MKKLIYFSLYFSEGAPIGFIWWALPSILAKEGMSTTEIATISALAVIPWTFKILLAPIVDLLSAKYFSLKKQLFLYQLCMGLALLFFEQAINSQQVPYILTILMIHGFFAALQDISIDSMAIKSLKKDELGSMNGIMQSGMLVGRSIFGGGGVYLAHVLGLKISIYFLITCIWISLIILQRSKIKPLEQTEIDFKKYITDFLNLLKNQSIWLLMAIAYFSTYSYNGISTIAGAVLTKKGATAIEYGITYSLIIPIMMSLGALLGGRYSDRLNSVKMLKLSLLITVITSIFVGIVLDYSQVLPIIIVTYALFYFFIGSTTATLYGLLMKRTSKEFAALEFSIFMGIVNVSDSSTSYLTGQLLENYSHTITTLIIGAICMIAFGLLYKVKTK